MELKILRGPGLAIAAVTLALSGGTAAPALAKKASPIHCAGINSCKGHGACKTAKNSCKGMNSCKGEGWLPAKSKEACLRQGGAVAAE